MRRHSRKISFNNQSKYDGLRGPYALANNLLRRYLNFCEGILASLVDSFFVVIPTSLCSLCTLNWLQLSYNNFSGDLFSTLQNCSSLYALDVGGNRISGAFPKWIGEKLPPISELRLQGNMLSGPILEQLCFLTHLHVLDLAHNNFSGSIPTCLGNLVGLKSLVEILHRQSKVSFFHSPTWSIWI